MTLWNALNALIGKKSTRATGTADEKKPTSNIRQLGQSGNPPGNRHPQGGHHRPGQPRHDGRRQEGGQRNNNRRPNNRRNRPPYNSSGRKPNQPYKDQQEQKSEKEVTNEEG